MKTRILKTTYADIDKFVPQWFDGRGWREYFRFDESSPYLHIAAFDAKEQALEHIRNPSLVEGAVVAEFPV